MTQFGLAQPAVALTATNGSDTILFYNQSAGSVVSANSVLGLEGNDIVSFGAQGLVGSARASYIGATVTGLTGGADLSGTLIGSAGTIYTANTSFTGVASGDTVLVTASGVVTSERAVRLLNNSQIYGNAGNDVIMLGNSITNWTSTTIGGGAGNDTIANYTYINGVTANASDNASAFTAYSANKVFIEGGGGNDFIDFVASASDFDSSTVQGGQGNDTIQFTQLGAGSAGSSQFLGGGGNDVFSGDFQSFINSTVAGGGGNDTITFTAQAASNNFVIIGDSLNVAGEFDGSDLITAAALGSYSSVTIQAGAGNDTVSFSGNTDGGNNLYQLNAGNDFLDLESLSASTIQAGAGNDSVHIAVDMLGLSVATLGGGNDSIQVSAAIEITSTVFAGTVNGGLGADEFFSANVLSAGVDFGTRFEYSTYEDSTLAAMDTIAVTAGSGQIFNFRFTEGGLSLADVGATANGFTATNGVVNFSAGFTDNLTARVEALNAGLTTAGTVAGFVDGDQNIYLFVQGGTTDTVIRVGDTTLSAASTQSTGLALALAAGNANLQYTT